MHSSSLRGSDFEICVEGNPLPHSAYFQDFSKTRRLGLFAPHGTDGAGAINLIMAYVTAFYDDYRADGDDFFAYPDFFAFQGSSPMAGYGMFDIWPEHKWVQVDTEPSHTLHAITDRGINVLLIPDGEPLDRVFGDIALASARRNIDRCYVYSPEGTVDDGDLTIRCLREPFADWIDNMVNTVGEKSGNKTAGRAWLDRHNGPFLDQSFRRLSLDEALARL